MKKITTQFDGKKIVLTDEYIKAIKQLLKAEILMMREQDDFPEAWYCGVAQLEDLANSNGIKFWFGGEEDTSWIKSSGHIYTEVPFDKQSKELKEKKCWWIFNHDWGKWRDWGITCQERECNKCGIKERG